MVCAFGGALALAGLIYPFIIGDARLAGRRVCLALRWCIALMLAGSALLLMLAPRADQPLLDVAEYLVPSLRALYFTAGEAEVFADAGRYAERYRLDAEKLNEFETRSRSQGEALDDYMVARISSFLKSYGEMRRGEQFVMQQVRARARERVRWMAGAGMLALALALALVIVPDGWNILRRRAADRTQ